MYTIEIEDQYAAKSIGIGEDEAKNAIEEGFSTETLEHLNQAVGGSFLDWIKRTYHKGHHLVTKYARPVATALDTMTSVAPMLKPAASFADGLAKSVGTGLQERMRARRGAGYLMN